MTLLYKRLLTIVGLILFILFIWFRFLRERLPKDIPFSLTLISFLSILFICYVYLYIIISLLIDYQPKSKLLATISSKLFKPWETLDESFKHKVIIEPYYEKFIIKISQWLKYHHKVKVSKPYWYINLYILFQIFPIIILILALSIDIFYFERLAYVYIAIPISLLILIGKYIRYSFKAAKEKYYFKLDKMVDEFVTNYYEPEDDRMFLTFRSVEDFVYAQMMGITYDDIEYNYSSGISDYYHEEFRKRNKLPLSYAEYRLTPKELDKIHEEVDIIMDIVISFSVYLEEYECAEKNSRVKYMRIFVFSVYFICWSYILFVSVNKLNIDWSVIVYFMDMISEKLQDVLVGYESKIEPFSDIDFIYKENKLNPSLYEKIKIIMIYIMKEVKDKEEPFSRLILFKKFFK